jgi:hypothetical protein
VPGFADMARVGLAEVENALATFQSPDAYSRSPGHEGRRIEPVEGGWRILNYEKYRFKLSLEDRRERDRIRKQCWRERQRSGRLTERGTKRDSCDMSRMSRQAEADMKQESCAEPDGSTIASAVITVPLNDNSEYPIFQQPVSEWSALFPAVHVGQQLRNMKAWLEANPTKATIPASSTTAATETILTTLSSDHCRTTADRHRPWLFLLEALRLMLAIRVAAPTVKGVC